ncbi:hypothetical protein SAMN05661008_00822 [Alkalithermobacter thermoalcaliphilus JW-YL-7 = DSM 7308]|uniref:Coat F domain protein n=1 Tax=Alkalithermobacter thermoalcaliphilus JW-YL-7 = DSM 7308 TaxID=1121328 RepID=A0A150FRW5_CLOPD|nr:hypothetical protein JWYL7_1030 [[Clostridium] paradoxum JW-YL-7 = DSM 7308]SHK75772.1 hypothetical protein SAMN05661008_00822 [[Clostridium] paradoxum JW-YL-7 = DSM 7308]
MNFNLGNKQIESNNLKVIQDQLNYECMMNKKFRQYADYCTDPSLKSLCNEAADVHKRNFNSLKSYLDSHQ